MAFLFVDRRADGLGASQVKKDADVWMIARAVQLLDSKDQVFRITARSLGEKTFTQLTAMKVWTWRSREDRSTTHSYCNAFNFSV
jgi:hypothetical protein